MKAWFMAHGSNGVDAMKKSLGAMYSRRSFLDHGRHLPLHAAAGSSAGQSPQTAPARKKIQGSVTPSRGIPTCPRTRPCRGNSLNTKPYHSREQHSHPELRLLLISQRHPWDRRWPLGAPAARRRRFLRPAPQRPLLPASVGPSRKPRGTVLLGSASAPGSSPAR